MKTQYIYKYLIIGIIALLFAACTNTDADQKFEQSPTERLQAKQKELNDLLLSSEFGWKAVYFTDNTQLGGYTHLFKFKNGGLVDMASDFDSDTAIYNSEYQIQLGSSVSLVFTTKNRIHLLSDSDNYPTAALRAKGYKGDFQFLYYGQENGEIIFKTNRAFIELHFVKATAQDWADLHKNIDMIANVIGAPTRPLFRLLETNDGTTQHQFDFSFTDITRFAVANSVESGSSMSYNMGIAYTPTGIVVDPAVEVGKQKLTNFTYDNVTGAFTATGTNNVTATIKYSDKPLVLTDDYKNLLDGKPQTVYGYIAAYLSSAQTNSPLCISLLNAVNATLPANQKLSRIQLNFNTPFGNYIEYRFAGGKKTIYHNVTTAENTTAKTIVLIHDSWDNGTALIPEPAYLKGIDAKLMDPAGLYVKKENFKIQFSNTIYTFTSASSPFRITTYGL
ncbi:DUF4302 domain-containing protein [Flavobacterium praedii]|uniref:DUF4302 domain-containing protein n=1 Tax=Flavobacterium praedii TaxID=3002900 RepID=UPI002481F13F|nr:DUF4302 domain-containing protein [Flavobacterium praedii]